MKVLQRIVQYDLVENIKNANTEACSDIRHQTSDRLSSFIFKAIKMHSSGFHFSFGQTEFALPFFPSNVNVCFRGLITRFGAAPPNL